jgi:prepilin-type N-terminal cleavage/methylation domain-containing protein
MARMLRDRMREERGFTLIELLAVILIIGILTAIILTQFIGHKDRSEDAQAKSNARNLVSQVEACFAANANYDECDTLTKLEGAGGIPWGTDPGEASVVSTTPLSYRIEGVSVSDLGGRQHVFSIEKDTSTGVITKECDPPGKGGCPTTGVW